MSKRATSEAGLWPAYEEENVELCRHGCRALCLLWFAVAPPFVLVDYVRFPQVFWTLLTLRAASGIVNLMVLWLLGTSLGGRHPRALTVASSVLGASQVFAMMSFTGGHASPYYAGIGLVILGTALLMPWPPIWSWSTSGILIAGYLLYSVVVEPIGDGRLFANNMFSFVATAMIAGLATTSREALRWREFVNRQALVRAHDELREQSDSQRRARDEAEAASRAKDEFLATLSHELRTPLHVIMGLAEMAQDQALDVDERAKFIAKIDVAGRQLLEMIDDTLEVSRLQSGRDQIRLEQVSLASFWTALRQTCAGLPHRPEVALDWSDIADIEMFTDPRKLLVIMRNLVSNALKFTERGSVRVDVARTGGTLCFRVADSGVGIREEDRESIFEMFRQVDGSDTRRYGGVGLGLYIARRLADQLDAAISLDSAVGRGSVFMLELPIQKKEGRLCAA